MIDSKAVPGLKKAAGAAQHHADFDTLILQISLNMRQAEIVPAMGGATSWGLSVH